MEQFDELKSQTITLKKEGLLMKAKDLRERFNGLQGRELDQLEILGMIGDIVLYLEEQEKQPPVYVPEPRLGPQPESEERAIERFRQLRKIIRAAEKKLAESNEESKGNNGRS